MISDWYACTYKEVTNDKGKEVGSNAVEGMLKPIYTRKLMKEDLEEQQVSQGIQRHHKEG